MGLKEKKERWWVRKVCEMRSVDYIRVLRRGLEVGMRWKRTGSEGKNGKASV